MKKPVNLLILLAIASLNLFSTKSDHHQIKEKRHEQANRNPGRIYPASLL